MKQLYYTRPINNVYTEFVRVKRPPRGLRPRFLLLEDRLKEIDDAIDRYKDSAKTIPLAWVRERNQILHELKTPTN